MNSKSKEFDIPLIHKRAEPKAIVSLNKDPAAFQGYSVQKISDIQFPIILRDEELIIDFGDHYTGYLNIELENADDFWIADAPVNFNFDFAEMPIELNEGIEFPEKALSCGWLQNDFKSVIEKIVILELPKFKKYKNKTQNQELKNWAEFIINPEKKMQGESKEIEKARRVLEEMSQDKNERYLAELRQKYIMDQKAIEDAGYDKGYDSGYDSGYNSGHDLGTLEGEKNKSIEIAKKMKSKKIDIEDIVEITGLTKEEIEKL